MITTTTEPNRIAITDRLSKTDLFFVTAAQAGTEHSQRQVDDDRVLGAITVVPSAGRRLALSTDGHRLHAVAVSGLVPSGVYSPSIGYRRDLDLSTDEWLHRLRQLLDDLQLPESPHSLELRVGQNHRENLLEAIDRYPLSIVAFRPQSITLHDVETCELLHRIDRARALSDRLRRHKVFTVRASVLRRPLAERMTVFTGRDQLAPVIGYRRQRLAVLMPSRPSVAVSTMWDTAGDPIDHAP